MWAKLLRYRELGRPEPSRKPLEKAEKTGRKQGESEMILDIEVTCKFTIDSNDYSETKLSGNMYDQIKDNFSQVAAYLKMDDTLHSVTMEVIQTR